MRKWIIATAVLLTVPMVGAAAVIVAPPVQEQLVEGHTVFSVIQVRNSTDEPDREEFAAAVAVLVREHVTADRFYNNRFPGVLWFNDQYLVNPEGGSQPGAPQPYRYPCGAVIAVNAGDPVPLVNGVPAVPAAAAYVETYHITDPNGAVWDVDKWAYDPDGDVTTLNSYPMWSVAMKNNPTYYGVPDDGKSNLCAPQPDTAGCGTHVLPITDNTPQRPPGYGGDLPFTQDSTYNDSKDTELARNGAQEGAGEGRFRCASGINPDGPGFSNPPARSNGYNYNAVLFFFLNDLTAFGGVKDHSASTDITACHASWDNAWPCPGGDDNAEGNSHPYNTEREWPFQLSEGRNNHGGSSGCGAGAIGEGAQYEHATCNVDVYFGFKEATLPAVRNYRVYDTEGQTAPYHCHESTTDCNEEEYNSAL